MEHLLSAVHPIHLEKQVIMHDSIQFFYSLKATHMIREQSIYKEESFSLHMSI